MEKRERNEAKEIKRKTKEGRRNGIETTAWGLSARVPFERAARLNEHHSTAQCRLTPLGAAVILVEALKRPTAFSWRRSWCREDNALSLSFASVLRVMYAREQPSKLGTIAFIRIKLPSFFCLFPFLGLGDQVPSRNKIRSQSIEPL